MRVQTFTDYEVIVINDGSKDHSGHICEDYASRDERIKVIHKAYGGVSAARNAGLERATGDYIGFVDGDDRIKYDMYERLHELCVQTNSDIRSEEHTSELQSRGHLVCRLLLEKKK